MEPDALGGLADPTTDLNPKPSQPAVASNLPIKLSDWSYDGSKSSQTAPQFFLNDNQHNQRTLHVLTTPS
jgi:hypothetical protein